MRNLHVKPLLYGHNAARARTSPPRVANGGLRINHRERLEELRRVDPSVLVLVERYNQLLLLLLGPLELEVAQAEPELFVADDAILILV